MKNKALTPEPTYATEAEIEAAIRTLSKPDLYRLSCYAQFRAGALAALGLGISGPDLLQETLKRTLAGKRRWPKAVSFVDYLIWTMKSISSAEVKKVHGAGFTFIDGPRDVREAPEEDCEGCWQLPSRTPEPERIVAARQELERLKGLFSDDERVLLVIDGLAEGMTGPDIQKCLELSQTDYETIMKRLRRGARRKD